MTLNKTKINLCIQTGVNVPFKDNMPIDALIKCIQMHAASNYLDHIGYFYTETSIEMINKFIMVNNISIDDLIKTYQTLPPFYKSQKFEGWIYGMGKFV
jgi:hypothetical protein